MSAQLESKLLQVGMKVWIYESDSRHPLVGTISRSGLKELKNTWYVRTKYGDRLYNGCRIYTDPAKLVSAVEDVISDLSIWLRDNDDLEELQERIK